MAHQNYETLRTIGRDVAANIQKLKQDPASGDEVQGNICKINLELDNTFQQSS